MFDSFCNTMAAFNKREEGNKCYHKCEFYEALCLYNESLMHANRNNSKELMSLAFANRSAVYFTMKQYALCLDNIKLAKDHGYPADKLPTLNEREKKCKEIMKNQKAKAPADDPWNFFKLSYPANEKIPSIVNCLELREDVKNKRGVFTNKNLKPGDIIAIEEPFIFFLLGNGVYRRCTNCLKGNLLSLIPCPSNTPLGKTFQC